MNSGSINQDDDDHREKQTGSEPDSQMILDTSTNNLLGGNSSSDALNLTAHQHYVGTRRVNNPSLVLQTDRMAEHSLTFVSVANTKANYDYFPPSMIERSLLASTLPVAASFHPAELFGSSADDRNFSMGAELRRQSADASLLRTAAFLESSLNLPSDPTTTRTGHETQNQKQTNFTGSYGTTSEGTVDALLFGRLVPQEPGLPVTNTPGDDANFEQNIARTQHSTAQGAGNTFFLLSQILSATSNPSIMGTGQTEAPPLLHHSAAAFQASAEVSQNGNRLEDVLHFGEGPEIFPMTLHRC
jgi:hypothetical protein